MSKRGLKSGWMLMGLCVSPGGIERKCLYAMTVLYKVSGMPKRVNQSPYIFYFRDRRPGNRREWGERPSLDVKDQSFIAPITLCATTYTTTTTTTHTA